MNGGKVHTVSTVSIDGLEEAEHDPEVDGDDVQVRGEVAVQEGAEDGACAQDEDFSGVCVLGRKTEWC